MLERTLRIATTAATAAALLLHHHETESFILLPMTSPLGLRGLPSYRCTSSSTPSSSCTTTATMQHRRSSHPLVLRLTPDGPAGSFFHPVPDSSDDDDDDNEDDGDKIINEQVLDSSSSTDKEHVVVDDDDDSAAIPEFDDAVTELLRRRMQPPRASRPSTINGVPTEKIKGFGKAGVSGGASSSTSKSTKKKSKKPYIEIGADATAKSIIPVNPINDPSKPEVDDQGYTLYTDEQTGQKSRVFDALVDYPCKFTLKIVGVNEGTFVQDIVGLVADACKVSPTEIDHSTKMMGKWTSITVQAPVASSVMLYSLYEKVDLDPRVKFKF
jgi:putative lipoic acid-binding regulatory protein